MGRPWTSPVTRSRAALVALCVALSLWPGRQTVSGNAKEKSPSSRARGSDRFGGVTGTHLRATGFFRVQQAGNRWVFVTPEGHPFWMRAVYGVDLNDGGAAASAAFEAKYQHNWFAFAAHAVTRLRWWGFNGLGEYSSPYVNPLPTYFRKQGNPEKMPFILLLNGSWYGAINRWELAPAPFKTLLAGAVDPRVYKGWPGHVPDVFDPNFAIYVRNLAADSKRGSRETIFTAKTSAGGLPQASLDHAPWLIGTTPDDADYLFGFGPAPEEPGRDKVVHPHLGWIVAVTRPTQTSNAEVGEAFGNRQLVSYQDSTVYAKQAWRNFLAHKYGTIQALNAAWGSSYTTFDSDGGWPAGRGLLDESGRHRWIGDDGERLATAAPRAAADMDEFLGLYAEQYFRIVSEAIRAATPHHLVFSPAPLNSHGGMTRRAVLRAAGRFCDVMQIGFDSHHPELLAKTYAETGKPAFVWVGYTANPDSPMRSVRGRRAKELTAANQQERSARYGEDVRVLWEAKTAGGLHPIVGLDWWEYMDKTSEEADWGLVTPRDNAYDGFAATVAEKKDRWGYVTGGEDRDYGDFLSGVRQVNLEIDNRLANELGRGEFRHSREELANRAR